MICTSVQFNNNSQFICRYIGTFVSRCEATTEKKTRSVSFPRNSFRLIALKTPMKIPGLSPPISLLRMNSTISSPSPRPISFHLLYSNLILFHAISFRSILFGISNPFQSTPFHPILPYLLRIRPPRRVYNVFPAPNVPDCS